MSTQLFWMIVVTILWLMILSFFIFAILPSLFEVGKAIRRFKNRVSRWLTNGG